LGMTTTAPLLLVDCTIPLQRRLAEGLRPQTPTTKPTRHTTPNQKAKATGAGAELTKGREREGEGWGGLVAYLVV